MSDLQCPVRVLLGRSGPLGRLPAGARVAAEYVWSAPEVADLRAALDDLADRHRGETVRVVVEDAGAAAAEQWVGRSIDGLLELEGDTSGWRVVR